MNKIATYILFPFLLCILFVSPPKVHGLTSEDPGAEALNIKDVLSKVKAVQAQISDMYAETTTRITSNLQLTPQLRSGQAIDNQPQTIIQQGQIWTSNDKSKIEITSPIKQITITNGNQVAVINPETGQKFVQEKEEMAPASGQMDLDKAMEYFDLSLKQIEGGNYVVSGIPKQANQFLSKMEFYIDAGRWVPVKVLMYGAQNKLLSQIEIEHQKISDIWVPVRNFSVVNTPMGKMEIEMEFKNIKVNMGISDDEFAINEWAINEWGNE